MSLKVPPCPAGNRNDKHDDKTIDECITPRLSPENRDELKKYGPISKLIKHAVEWLRRAELLLHPEGLADGKESEEKSREVKIRTIEAHHFFDPERWQDPIVVNNIMAQTLYDNTRLANMVWCHIEDLPDKDGLKVGPKDLSFLLPPIDGKQLSAKQVAAIAPRSLPAVVSDLIQYAAKLRKEFSKPSDPDNPYLLADQRLEETYLELSRHEKAGRLDEANNILQSDYPLIASDPNHHQRLAPRALEVLRKLRNYSNKLGTRS